MLNDYAFILPIALGLVLAVVSPGPNFLMVAQTAMTKNRMNAVAVAAGMGVGGVVYTSLAVLGLFLMFEVVPWLYAGFKLVGGAYLCYLAYKIWKTPTQAMSLQTGKAAKPRQLLKSVLIGLATQLSNPKAAILFAGIYATFLPQNPPPNSLAVLCAMIFIIEFSWYSVVALLLSNALAKQFYDNYKQAICQVAGGFMGFLGIKLVLDK